MKVQIDELESGLARIHDEKQAERITDLEEAVKRVTDLEKEMQEVTEQRNGKCT